MADEGAGDGQRVSHGLADGTGRFGQPLSPSLAQHYLVHIAIAIPLG